MRRQPDFQEIDGQAIGIALIDTGVDGTHDLLQDNYVTSLDLVYGHAGPIIHPTTVHMSLALRPRRIQTLALPPMPISFPYRFSQSLMAMLHGSIFWNLYNGFAKITVRTTSKL
jgi:subtilisin family serine protease